MQMGSNLVISIPNLKKKKKELWRAEFLKCGFPTFLCCPDTGVPTRDWRNITDSLAPVRALFWSVSTCTRLAESLSQKGSSLLKTLRHWCYLLLGAATQGSAQWFHNIITEIFFSSLVDPLFFSCFLQSNDYWWTRISLVIPLSFPGVLSYKLGRWAFLKFKKHLLVASPDHLWNLASYITGRKSTIAAIAAISQILC